MNLDTYSGSRRLFLGRGIIQGRIGLSHLLGWLNRASNGSREGSLVDL